MSGNQPTLYVEIQTHKLSVWRPTPLNKFRNRSRISLYNFSSHYINKGTHFLLFHRILHWDFYRTSWILLAGLTLVWCSLISVVKYKVHIITKFKLCFLSKKCLIAWKLYTTKVYFSPISITTIPNPLARNKNTKTQCFCSINLNHSGRVVSVAVEGIIQGFKNTTYLLTNRWWPCQHAGHRHGTVVWWQSRLLFGSCTH